MIFEKWTDFTHYCYEKEISALPCPALPQTVWIQLQSDARVIFSPNFGLLLDPVNNW